MRQQTEGDDEACFMCLGLGALEARGLPSTDARRAERNGECLDGELRGEFSLWLSACRGCKYELVTLRKSKLLSAVPCAFIQRCQSMRNGY